MKYPIKTLISYLRREDLYLLLFSFGLNHNSFKEMFHAKWKKNLYMSWWISALKEVNDGALNFFLRLPFSLRLTNSWLIKTKQKSLNWIIGSKFIKWYLIVPKGGHLFSLMICDVCFCVIRPAGVVVSGNWAKT